MGTRVINPALYPKLRYDPVKGCTPIALTHVTPHVLVIGPSLPSFSSPEKFGVLIRSVLPRWAEIVGPYGATGSERRKLGVAATLNGPSTAAHAFPIALSIRTDVDRRTVGARDKLYSSPERHHWETP